MKFVYCGYDFMFPAVRRLIDDGHVLAGVFSFECDNFFNFNHDILKLAADLNLPVITEKPQSSDIQAMIEGGAECFISAGYPFKIPPLPEHIYGLNFHPSLLPKGRGLMPTPYILIDYPEASGVSVHKLTPVFDDGDILYQEPLPLQDRETVETLSARIAMRGPDILSMIMGDLPKYWSEAQPQDPAQASKFPPPNDEMRVLDWSLNVRDLDKIARAFGRFGSLALFDQQIWVVYDLDVWPEDHKLAPGTVVLRQARQVVIAARDGFVCLKDFQVAQGQAH